MAQNLSGGPLITTPIAREFPLLIMDKIIKWAPKKYEEKNHNLNQDLLEILY